MKIGVLGCGHLGKIHLRCIRMIDDWELVGFYDPDAGLSQKVSKEFETNAFGSVEELLGAVDVIDIVTPTITHFELAKQAIAAGKHVFLEKPVTHTLEQAYELKELVRKHGVRVQVGHVERFNPAVKSLDYSIFKPMFIEAHRLSNYNPRGTDVPVILDLMIHDLDLILHWVDSEVQSVQANGVSVVSRTPDICNARIEFENGCVANVTASRISLKQMRKLRLFQPDAYISLDFLEKQAQVVRLEEAPGDEDGAMVLDTDSGKKLLKIEMPEIEEGNAIRDELQSFYTSIVSDTKPTVSLSDGIRALKLAYQILDIIHEQNAKLA